MTKITCPRCGSEEVKRTPGLGTVIIALIASAGLFLFFGIFFPPLLIVAGLALLGAMGCFGFYVLLTILSIGNKKAKEEREWTWSCSACNNLFSKVPENI